MSKAATPLALIVSTLCFFISSCSGSRNMNKVTTQASTELPVTQTSLSNPLPTIEETPTLRPLPAIRTQCVTDPDESRKSDLPGVIVLKQPGMKIDFQAADKSGQMPSFDFGFYLFDPNKKQPIKSISYGWLEQVSPDGKYLAYLYGDLSSNQDYLGLLDSSGAVINEFTFYFDGSVQEYYNWQNSDQLRTVAIANQDRVIIHLLSPFTKEHNTLKTDWNAVYKPNNPFHDKLVEWKFDEKATSAFFVYGANILYDSTLTRVVYPKAEDIVSLVDVETEQELASAQFKDWGYLPSWSPSGEYLTILNREENADEIYLVSRDGSEFQRITNFSNEFQHALVTQYTWSPDSKRIALWLDLEQNDLRDDAQSELAILDMPGGQVTRLCIHGISANAYEPWTMNHPEPIWSPDGRYILITQWDDPTSHKDYEVLVIDTLTGFTEKISKNTAPIGWMIENK